ncbi:interferon alpha/beta receptor 1-like [Bufo gargarizans]|uniref:interferon alpha/beta receptor 1-like n=1 Tax=Bufo gargarizans TaxID=30331 RepID=UPI001CF5CFF5|nr:interferon alpha/beta receptor 1-like [Bufo gargarizans]
MARPPITLLLPVICMVVMASGEEDPGTITIRITKSVDGFSATWSWDDHCLEEDDVAFTAVYKKVGAPDNESQECVITEDCFCKIPPDLLDYSHNYTLLISATAPGENLTNSKDFDPNCRMEPPPEIHVKSMDALVILYISTPGNLGEEEYNLSLRRNDSTEEKSESIRVRNYIIPPNALSPGQVYCLKVNVYNILTMAFSPFSPEECFTAPAKAPPNNLRMEALDSRYLLKWDWDFDQSPNVTFSVEKCHNYDGRCTKVKGCENITATRCRTALPFKGDHILRASVYDSQRGEKSSSVIQFSPYYDTHIGPPKNVTMRIVNKELFIDVSAPEGFKDEDIDGLCGWLTHLEYWTNSTHNSEVTVKEEKRPFFKIESLEESTTYCAKAKMKCEDRDRSSLYSQVYCITTDPKSYLFAWIIGCTIVGIVLISFGLYICFCPLKRCIKHTFFPSNRLPSSIEKGFGELPLDCIKHPFLLHEEETMDQCYIVQNSHTECLVQDNSSQDNSQESGNYSDTGQTTGEAGTCAQ